MEETDGSQLINTPLGPSRVFAWVKDLASFRELPQASLVPNEEQLLQLVEGLIGHYGWRKILGCADSSNTR